MRLGGFVMVAASFLACAAVEPESVRSHAPSDATEIPQSQTALQSAGQPQEKQKSVHPDAADPGAKNIKALTASFKAHLFAEPYGQKWSDGLTKEPDPAVSTRVGDAETLPELKQDKIEMQDQAQYLEETGFGSVFGHVSVRSIRFYAFGRLLGTRIVIAPAGQDVDAYYRDVAELGQSWQGILTEMDLRKKFRLTRNDFVERENAAPKQRFKPPLLIQLQAELTTEDE